MSYDPYSTNQYSQYNVSYTSTGQQIDPRVAELLRQSGTNQNVQYTTTTDYGVANPGLSYSYTQDLRSSHEPLRKSAAPGGFGLDVHHDVYSQQTSVPTSYTNYTTTQGANVHQSDYNPGAYGGSTVNFTTSNYVPATSYTVTSNNQNYATGPYSTTFTTQPNYSAGVTNAQSTYISAPNVDHTININAQRGVETAKQSRQVQSVVDQSIRPSYAEHSVRASQSVAGQVQGRQSLLTSYRPSMYPEFELVEDLPERPNLLNSINAILNKSPNKEPLLAAPSDVKIQRESMMSPASITVLFPLKEKYEDGSIYEGEGRNGQRHGRGRITYRNGRIYEGEFRDGRAQGRGVSYYANGQVCYEGDIVDSLFEGRGVLNCEAPTPLQGGFDCQDFERLGNYWTRYEGEFKGGKKNGRGVLYLTNGDRFSGEFRNDKAEGRGTYEQRDGRVVQGIWENNRLKQQTQ